MVGTLITEQATRQADRPAVVANGQTISYGLLLLAICRMRALVLADCRLEVRGLAVVATVSSLRSWIAVIALRSVGFDTIAVRDGEQIAHLGLGPIACVVLCEAELAAGIGKAPRTGDAPLLIMKTGLFAGLSAPPDGLPDLTSQGAHVLYSSGTTGGVRKIAFPGSRESGSARARARFYGFDRGTVFNISDFGLWTAAGFKYPLAVWAAGGCVVFDQVEAPLDRLTEHGVDTAFLTPDRLERFAALREAGQGRCDTLRIIVAGGLLPMPLARRVTSQVTPRLTNIYTSTEIDRTALRADHAGDPDALQWLTAGDGVCIEIVDESGAVCAVGVEGALRYRLGPGDCQGYVDDPEATARHFRDGWFYPGDLAVRRADERIRILGRDDAVIELAGQKRAAAPIEGRIRDQLGVAAVCLFAGLDRTGARRLVVAIESDRPLPQRDLQPVVQVLAAFGPVTFHLLADFPRTANGMGKIERSRLRRMVMHSGDPRDRGKRCGRPTGR